MSYRFVPYLIALAVLLLLPQFVSTYYQDMLTKVLIFAIFAMSLDLVMGFTGLISFGWAAFFGISGYSVAILTTHYGVTSFWVVLPLALLVTAVLAAGIGYLSLRVSGIYFLLVTMAFAQLLVIVATKWYYNNRRSRRRVRHSRSYLGFITIDWTNLNFYYFALIFFVLPSALSITSPTPHSAKRSLGHSHKRHPIDLVNSWASITQPWWLGRVCAVDRLSPSVSSITNSPSRPPPCRCHGDHGQRSDVVGP